MSTTAKYDIDQQGNCSNCGGVHFGSGLICPYRVSAPSGQEETSTRLCTNCGNSLPCKCDEPGWGTGDASGERATECGQCVTHVIAGASWIACALPKGHDGGHRGQGTCFKHGKYFGEVGSFPQCPAWPTCVAESVPPASQPAAMTAEQFRLANGWGEPSSVDPDSFAEAYAREALRGREAELARLTQCVNQRTAESQRWSTRWTEEKARAETAEAQVRELKARVTELEDALSQNIACFEKVSAKITEFTFWPAGERTT